ncbi:helix-turn-helix domain-containing protein [Streptomyces sp. NPDC101227]|uniref:AraC-like ligand-binding domain-containing protein n=1 Tax=Streptomyces sp. NPDC101227 TaxID=3366136 RepID=UPI0037F7DC97
MLGEEVFRTEAVPAAERLAYWAERMAQTHAPLSLSSDHARDFRASQRVLDLGAVSMWPATIQQVVYRRTPKLIRQSDPDVYHLSLVVDGTGIGRWDDQEVVYRPSDLAINDSARPWEICSGAAPVTSVGLEVPKALLPLPRNMAGHTVPRWAPAREGIGALLAQFLTQLCADTTPYQPSDGPRLGTVLTDLVAALFAQTLETGDALVPEARRRTLILRIKHFIQEHLHDPGLTPADVAAAHHISISYLHGLFQDEEATVAAWIRLRRLEAARRNLTDPALRTTPIHAIATRWGFPRAGCFTRAFRAAYGVPPSDYRHQELASTQAPASPQED